MAIGLAELDQLMREVWTPLVREAQHRPIPFLEMFYGRQWLIPSSRELAAMTVHQRCLLAGPWELDLLEGLKTDPKKVGQLGNRVDQTLRDLISTYPAIQAFGLSPRIFHVLLSRIALEHRFTCEHPPSRAIFYWGIPVQQSAEIPNSQVCYYMKEIR